MEHDHNHKPSYNKAFALGISLNLIYIVVEFVYGIIANSMALIADAGHNLSDVLGLVLAWGAHYLASKSPTDKRTYGFRKSTVLASLTNAVILLIAVGAIAFESIKRFTKPQVIESEIIIYVALIGVAINAFTAYLFFADHKRDLNIKGAFLHMAADAAVSLGVVIAAVIIRYTNYYWIDPIISLVIVLIITLGTWGLLRESLNLSLDAVPKNINIEEVRNYLSKLDGVKNIHDLHIWAMSTTETALTVHLCKPDASYEDNFIEMINRELKQKYEIDHATIQIETSENCNNCSMNGHNNV